ncbi:MAG: M24 family metallopeptidase [Candidatus Hodarchaeota archaeon]
MTYNAKNVSRLQESMRNSDIGVIIVPLGINFSWLFQIMEEPSERLVIGIVGAEGIPKLILPSFEIDRMKKLTGISECIGWDEKEDPYRELNDLIPEEFGNVIGIEPKMWFTVYQRLTKSLPTREFISAEKIFDELRAVKDKEEQKFLAKASLKSGDAIIETLNELEAGVSESEVNLILMNKLNWGAGEKAGALIQFGDNTALPHYKGGERKLKKDDIVLIDAGGTLKNYWGDITMTTVFGKASRRFRELYDLVFEANKKGKEAVEQNKLPCEVDEVTRGYIEKKGYGKYFTHRTGHGIGLEVHEHPYIFGSNKIPLVSGNVFTIEPGIYLPGEFGIRIEDDVIKTSTGIETSEIPRYEQLEI